MGSRGIMKKVCAYGLDTFDNIYRVNKDDFDGRTINPTIRSRAGGINNFHRVLSDSDRTVVGLLPERCDKTDIVVIDGIGKVSLRDDQWPASHEFMADPTASWHHLMYLDTCKFDQWFFDGIKEGIVSADVVSDIGAHVDKLKHIDFLFLSQETALNSSVNGLRDFVRRGVIIHCPDNVLVQVDNRFELISVNKMDGINPIGAGDYFAAFFADEMMHTDDPMESARSATERATEYLKENAKWED